MTDRELMTMAREASMNAYVPYSRFPVGAAIECADGSVYSVVDEYWMDHIDAMTELKRGIGLRGYGATKPIDAYKQEGFDMFEAMVRGIREETVRRLYTVRVRVQQPIERKAVAKNAAANVGGEPEKKKPVKKAPKPGRNDPCPC